MAKSCKDRKPLPKTAIASFTGEYMRHSASETLRLTQIISIRYMYVYVYIYMMYTYAASFIITGGEVSASIADI